jgi:hypothetical protein
MSKCATALGPVLLIFALAACPPPEPELTTDAVADAFGLVDGRVMHYAVEQGTADTEDHSFERSNSYAERMVTTRTERNQGFVRMDSDGTAAVSDFEATLDGVLLVARGDCLPRCVDYDPPISVALYPWTSGDRHETTTTATVRENETVTEHEERHVFTIGSEGALSTDAGDFDVLEISWQRFIDADVGYATLYLAADVGLVGIDRFDGASLRLSEQED